MAETMGVKAVWGLPARILPVDGIPSGAKVKFRFRGDRFGTVFYQLGGETVHAVLTIPEGQSFYGATHWEIMEQGRNVRT